MGQGSFCWLTLLVRTRDQIKKGEEMVPPSMRRRREL